MPDWIYRTLHQPVLFALPSRPARDLALGLIGALARTRPGRLVIATLGHMRPDPRLAVNALGLRFASPVGLSARLDPSGRAAEAFACFGLGFIEVGPLALEARGDALFTERTRAARSLRLPPDNAALPADSVLEGPPRRAHPPPAWTPRLRSGCGLLLA